jgi:hypothetical protein
MIDSKALRRRAEQARRAASVRTYGDSMIDRDLTKLAEELEHDAEEQEREKAANRS